MTTLFHTLAYLARLRWLGAAFCALAMLCVTTHAPAIAGATAHARIDVNATADIITTASASAVAQTKTRVWGFEQNSPLSIYSLRVASAEQHPGISPGLPETASASSYAAEGGASIGEGLTPRARAILDYARDVEQQTGRGIHAAQRSRLAQALREKEFTRLSSADTARSRSAFNRARSRVIGEWETQTGQAWPRYSQDVINPTTGQVLRKLLTATAIDVISAATSRDISESGRCNCTP